MMRRARVAVKPNIRPGGRSVAGREQPSQAVADAAAETQAAVRNPPSPQQSPLVDGPAEAVGVEITPTSPSEKASTDLNNGVPSSGTTTPAAVPQRRMRISATPKLGPKTTSAPRTLARFPQSVPSTLPKEALLQVPNAESESPAPENVDDFRISGSTTPTERARQSSTTHSPSSPCLPSTSGFNRPPIYEKKSVEHSPPSPQPGQVPQQPNESEPHKYPKSASDMPSANVSLSCSDVPESPRKRDAMSSDTEKILRALKLKELMKIERRKDLKQSKRGFQRNQEYVPVDRSKMTMKELIYYLPNTSPMRHSTVCEEAEEETVVPPSPKIPEKTPDWEEYEEEEEEEEMLVPKVRVAEDGSIILDEESLTVRVQRPSKTKVVENSNALFEHGSTTTYRSFRNWNHVKVWSVRETDMFFLAISMVGTDFSLIGQLLPHRCRTEIKNKFKKEEKTNGWRIDKAFRDKRPYDREFFSYLLEKVLSKDKKKGKSVKLVMTTPKKRQRAKGKKAKGEGLSIVTCDEGSFDIENGGHVDAEKENEGLLNVNEADHTVPAKKRRKRTKAIDEGADKDDCSEEQGEKKTKRKRARKTKKEILSSERDAEGGSVGNDSVNADQENEHDSSELVCKKKRKRRLKKDEKESQDGASVEGSKSKRSKKSLKAQSESLEDSTGANAESSIAGEGDPAVETKRLRCSQKGNLNEDSGKSSTKRKKSQKGKALAEDGEDTITGENGEISDAKKKVLPADKMDKPSKRSSRQPKKPKPNLATKRRSKTSEEDTTVQADEEVQESQCESKVISEGEVRPLDTEKHMERTPPRMTNLTSPSNIQHKSNEESENPPASPAVSEGSSGQQSRRQRAERVKRSLTAEEEKKVETKSVMNQDETQRDSGASTEEMSPTDLPKQMVTQESEEIEAENTLDENLIDSCLHHLHSQTFQRRPMVVLSREEVSKILNVQDQTTDEDPSVSPLDLSLNTEMSFQLQCSNLMEENAEAALLESAVEEHEDSPQEMASCHFVFEEKHCKDMGSSAHVLGSSTLSTLANVSPSTSTGQHRELHHPTAVFSHLEASSVSPSSIDYPEPQVKTTSFEVKDLEGSPHVVALETVASKDSVCSILETSQGSVLETPKMKDRPEGSDVAALLGKEGSQEDKEQAVISSCELSSGASTSSEHCATLKRSRFLKPKPNLSVTSKNRQSSQKQTAKTVPGKASSEKLLPQSTVMDSAEEDLSKDRFSKEQEKSQPWSVDMESSIGIRVRGPLIPKADVAMDNSGNQADPVLCDVSPAVLEERLVSTVSQSGHSVEQPELTSGNTCYMNTRPPCAPEAEDLQVMDNSCSWLLPTQSAEQETTGQMMDGSEEIYTPAKIIQPRGGGNSEEEPTFVLTLYEIPVDETCPASASNESVMISLLPFSDQASLPSSSKSLSAPQLMVEKNSPVLGGELHQQTLTQETAQQTIQSQVKDGANEVASKLETENVLSESECKESPELVPLETKDMLDVLETKSNVEGPQLVPPDTKYMPDVPDTELKPKKEEDPELVAVETKDGLDVPDTESKSEKEEEGLELVSYDNLKPTHQSTPFPARVSKCITAKTPDASQDEGVSHLVLADVFVPVLELEDDLVKDCTRFEELTKQEYSPARPELMTKEAKNRPSLPKKKDAPADCKLKPHWATRLPVKGKSLKTDQPSSSQIILPSSQQSSAARAKHDSVPGTAQTEQQITLSSRSLSTCVGSVSQDSHLVPAPDMMQSDVEPERTTAQEKLTGHQRAPCSPAVIGDDKTTPIKRRAKIQVKPSLIQRKSAKKECPKLPQGHLATTQVDSAQTSSSTSREAESETKAEVAARLLAGHTTVKPDLESSSNIKESSLPTHKVANVCPSHEDISGMVTTASCSGSLEVEEENEGVSHTVLADVFVPVSEEKGNDLSQNWLVPVKCSPQGEDGSLPEKAHIHSEKFGKVQDDEKVRQQDSSKSAKKTSEAKGSSDSKTLEEHLQRQHQIMPCAVKISKCTNPLPLDKEETEGVSRVAVPEEGEQYGSVEWKVKKADLSSPPSTSLRESSILKKTKAETKKSPAKKKDKLLVKLPDFQTISGRPRPQLATSEGNEKTCGGVSHTALVTVSQDTGESSTFTSKMAEESTEEPSASQMKKSPVKRRAKLKVKPIITNRMCAKDEGDGSKSDQPQSVQPTSPTRQRTRATVLKKEFDPTSKKPIKEVSEVSRMETNSEAKECLSSDPQSPKHSAVWPRVILPRIPTSEAGFVSGSSTPASSPIKVSIHKSLPQTQQSKTSPATAPKEGSPKSSDDTEDEQSRVSHFFLTDIFTEVEDED